VAVAYCALCGTETDAQKARPREPAACGPQCAGALEAVDLLRQRESGSVRVGVRRRAEYEHGLEHAPALSEIMLKRWRAGDWTISPDRILAQLAVPPNLAPVDTEAFGRPPAALG